MARTPNQIEAALNSEKSAGRKNSDSAQTLKVPALNVTVSNESTSSGLDDWCEVPNIRTSSQSSYVSVGMEPPPMSEKDYLTDMPHMDEDENADLDLAMRLSLNGGEEQASANQLQTQSPKNSSATKAPGTTGPVAPAPVTTVAPASVAPVVPAPVTPAPVATAIAADSKELEKKHNADVDNSHIDLLKTIPQTLLQYWFTSAGKTELIAFIDYADIKAKEVQNVAEFLKSVLADKALFIQIRHAIKIALEQKLKAADFISKEAQNPITSSAIISKIATWRTNYARYIREAEKQLTSSSFSAPSAPTVSLSHIRDTLTNGLGGLDGSTQPTAPAPVIPKPPRVVNNPRYMTFEEQMALAMAESLKEQPQRKEPLKSPTVTSTTSDMGDKGDRKASAEISPDKQGASELSQSEEDELRAAMQASRLAYAKSFAAAESNKPSLPLSVTQTGHSGSHAYGGFGLPLGLGDIASQRPSRSPAKSLSIAEQKKQVETQITQLKASIADAEARSYIKYMEYQKESTKIETSMTKRLAELHQHKSSAELALQQGHKRGVVGLDLQVLLDQVKFAHQAYVTFVQEGQRKMADINRLKENSDSAKKEVERLTKKLQQLKMDLQGLDELSVTTYSDIPSQNPSAASSLSLSPIQSGGSSAQVSTENRSSSATSSRVPAPTVTLGPIASAVADLLEPLPTLPADLFSTEETVQNQFDLGSLSPYTPMAFAWENSPKATTKPVVSNSTEKQKSGLSGGKK